MLETAILIVMVIVGLAIVGLILVQQGKGADMGASFGSGASNTVFGSQGSGNFLTHTTAVLAAVFFACCLALAWYGNNKTDRGGIDFSSSEVQLKEIPAAPDVPTITPAQPAAGDVPATPAASDTPAVEATVVPSAPESSSAPVGEAAGATSDAAPEGDKDAPASAPAEQQKSQ